MAWLPQAANAGGPRLIAGWLRVELCTKQPALCPLRCITVPLDAEEDAELSADIQPICVCIWNKSGTSYP